MPGISRGKVKSLKILGVFSKVYHQPSPLPVCFFFWNSPFSAILGLIKAVTLLNPLDKGFQRYFQYCTSAYCTKKHFHYKSPPGGHFTVFFSLPWVFSLFLENRLVSSEIRTYILNNTLMVVRLKILMEVLPFAWC